MNLHTVKPMMNSSNTRQAAWLAGAKNYLGLVAALLAMCVMFAFLSENFLSSATFITLSNDIPPLVVMSVA